MEDLRQQGYAVSMKRTLALTLSALLAFSPAAAQPIVDAEHAEASRPMVPCEHKGILHDLRKGLALLLNMSHGERLLSEFTEKYLEQRDLNTQQRGFLGEQALRTHQLSKAASKLHERLLKAEKCLTGSRQDDRGLYLVPVRCFREAQLLRDATNLRMEVVYLRNQLRDGRKELVKSNPPPNKCGRKPCRLCLGNMLDGLRKNQDIVLDAIHQTGIKG